MHYNGILRPTFVPDGVQSSYSGVGGRVRRDSGNHEFVDLF